VIKRQILKGEHMAFVAVAHRYAIVVEDNARAVTSACELKNCTPQLCTRHLRSFSGYQCLTRSRGLAAIRVMAYPGKQIKAVIGAPSASAQICVTIVFDP